MLPKKYRLTKEKDFQRVFQQGRYYGQACPVGKAKLSHRAWLGIRIARNDLKISRFGFLIGLKISKKATVRNKLKRRLSETIRLKLNQIKPGFDVIILAQPEIVDKRYREIDEALVILLRKAKILENRNSKF